MLSLARTQKNQCHVVTGGHQEPDILLPFFWMSSAHGVKEEGGNIFYLSKLLLPHIHKTPEGFMCCLNQTAAKIQSIGVTQKGG